MQRIHARGPVQREMSSNPLFLTPVLFRSMLRYWLGETYAEKKINLCWLIAAEDPKFPANRTTQLQAPTEAPP